MLFQLALIVNSILTGEIDALL